MTLQASGSYTIGRWWTAVCFVVVTPLQKEQNCASTLQFLCSIGTWSGTIRLTPLWKSTSWGRSTCCKRCWCSSTQPSFSLSSALQEVSGLAQLQKQTSEDYRGQFRLLKGLLVLLCPPSKNCIHTEWEKRAQKITLDPLHPSHLLFEMLASNLSIYRIARQTKSFFPQAICLKNS